VIFGLISPFQHIEANWAAFYVISAAAWIILNHPQISPRFMWWGGFANIIVTSVILLHSYYPLTTKQVNKDRILRETHGYRELTKFLSRIREPVFADTYQNVSMLSFYDPHGTYAQWPGIARISEAMRRQEMVPYQLNDLIAKRGFYLLTDNFIPPEIPGFYAAELWQILDCLNQPIEVQKASLVGRPTPSCSPYVHRWTFVYYQISETAIPFPKIELPELGHN
jgi:hypothetical protein